MIAYHRLLTLLVLLAPAAVGAQTTGAAPAAEPGISDNSFLVEEAYNQDPGVVQHINTFRRARDKSWAYTFTQEWPAPSQRHQLSYTVAVLGARDAGTGLGDLVMNYRYQAIGKDEERVWLAPRLSVSLPTGDVASGRGAGGVGAQVMLPLSVSLGNALVTHWDVGASATRARAINGVQQTSRGLTAAASAVWLVAPTFNFMLETAWDYGEPLDDAGVRAPERHFVISPGIRAAINLPSGMQIVPGIGVPIGVGPSRGDRDLFLYFSVEHPFK